MAYLPILAEQMTDPRITAALLEHREDRAVLLASLTASLQSDPRVRAAWLWGSFGRGEADDLSDLDPWLVVADDAVAEMGPRLRRYGEQTGTFLSGKEAPHNAPPGGGYFGSLHAGRHGLLHVDTYWQPVSAVSTVPAQGVLFDRLYEPVMLPSSGPPADLSTVSLGSADTEREERIAGGLGFAWLMFSIAAKFLARDPASDLSLMFYPKPGLEEAAVLLGQDDALGLADWTVPIHPQEKVARLRHLVGKMEQLRLAAVSQGCIFSPVYAPCLFHYLDMTAGILHSQGK